MVAIVLYKPKIPPNTGNIMRLCANNGFSLHLIEPLGFSLSNKLLKRAKMDYHTNIEPIIYKSFSNFLKKYDKQNLSFISKYGKKKYTDVKFNEKSVIIFGSETTGISESIKKRFSNNLYYIPMIKKSRSINLLLRNIYNIF